VVALQPRNLKVIGIQNYGPSGTMLLHSLLDGHPQVLALPGLYPIGIYSGWRTLVNGLSRGLTVDDVMTFLLNWVRPLYDKQHLEFAWGLAELGENRDANCCVSPEDFRRHLAAALHEMRLGEILAAPAEPSATAQQARKIAVLAVYIAYARCLGLEIEERDTIVYPAHSSEIQDLRDLHQDFPELFVIHMIRDPVDGLFSTVKHSRIWLDRFLNTSLVDPFLAAIVQMTTDRTPLVPRLEPFHAMTPFAPAVASRCRAIRLEDLHQVPERTMRTIAHWVGLTWDGALLQSTFAGKKWWNRPGLSRLSGFRTGMSRVDDVAAWDRRRIAAVTSPVRRKYNYDTTVHHGHVRHALALAGLIAPFAVERTTSNRLRHFALFVTRVPLRTFPQYHRRREPLLSALFEARTAMLARPGHETQAATAISLEWVREVVAGLSKAGASHACPGRIEWWCAVLYGRTYTYWANRHALLNGVFALRRRSDWVEPLMS
jgi:hypothetical protein